MWKLMYRKIITIATGLLLVLGMVACDKKDNEGSIHQVTEVGTDLVADKRMPYYPSGPTLGKVGDAEVFSVGVSDNAINVGVRWPKESIARVVTIEYSREREAEWFGFQASIQNGYQTMFGIDISSNADMTMYRVVETCGLDRLQIDHEWVADSILKETYFWEGDELALSFDTATVIDDSQKLVLQDEFQAFYSGSSLENNADGTKLVKLVDLGAFWQIVDDQLVSQGYIETAKYINWADAGAISTIIALGKCTLGGGILNPICIAATGVSIAVAVAHVICWMPFVDCNTAGLPQ